MPPRYPGRRKLAPAVLHVEVNPDDAARLGIAAAVAFVTPVVQTGSVFMPMHFADVNRLTHSAYDPHSRQPGYKACVVAVAPAAGDTPAA